MQKLGAGEAAADIKKGAKGVAENTPPKKTEGTDTPENDGKQPPDPKA
jgi:hypothetical protein